jgi:hypothetical protein
MVMAVKNDDDAGGDAPRVDSSDEQTDDERDEEVSRILCDGVQNAHEYAIRRLEGIDASMSPSELAKEYDCSNTHMRNVCRNLLDNGDIENPRFGKYRASSSGGSDGDDSGPDAQPDRSGESSGVVDGDSGESDDGGDEVAEVAAVGAATAGAAVPAVLDREISPVALALIGVALILVVGFLLFADPDEPDDDPEPVPSTDANADFAGAFEQ